MTVLSLDFDGVLAEYHGYKGRGVFGKPMPGVKQFLERIKKAGIGFVVITTRKESKLVKEWFVKNDLPLPSKITNQKVSASAYVDDRGITFTGDFDKLVKDLRKFTVHWRDKKVFKDL
ncbi:hypothetical protein CMO91_01635 [Candidatus Woesearchaeota archaeon]|nr:hypothetical protein [Candidatus Woesearchaeota archaeon]|tara:strand:- start:126 stop:479 length:354 start_codon:yes stop_codon:yes gene_type:complete